MNASGGAMIERVALLVEINDEMTVAERRYIAAAAITPLLEKGDQLASLPAAPRT